MEVRGFQTTAIEIIRRTHDIKSFRFFAPQDVYFKPGQCFVLTIKIKGQDATKHFLFSSSPTERGFIEFTKRIRTDEFSEALDQLRVGDWARIRMPFGFFTFEGEHDKIALLSGGIGITAIRSMCKFASDERLLTDIILIYGNKTENGVAFHEDLLRMESENEKLRAVYALSDPIDKIKWKGRVGFINTQIQR